MRRVLFTTLAVLAIALLLLAAGVMWIGATQSGTQWLTQRVVAWLPDTLSIGQVSGRLFSPLQLDDVTVNAGGSRVAIKHVALAWQPGALLRGDLHILRLAAHGVTVTLPPPSAQAPEPSQPTPPFSLPPLNLPVAVQVLDFAVSDFQILKADSPGTPFYAAESLHAAAALDDAGIKLDILQLKSSLLNLQAEAELSTQDTRRVQLNANWELRLPNQPALAAQARIHGPLSDLALQLELSAPARAHVTGNVRGFTVAAVPDWALQIQVENTALTAVNARWPALTVGGNLEVAGTGAQQVTATANITAQHQELDVIATANAAWDGETATLSQLTLALPQHAMTASARGTVTPLQPQPDADLTVEWSNLRWPLNGAPKVTSPRGEAAVRGSAEDYRFRVDTEVDTAHVPHASLWAQGTGNTAHVQVNQLNVQTGSTQVNAAGTLAWRAGVRFAAAGQWQSLRWPLADTATLTSNAGHFHGAGTPQAFALAVDGDVTAKGAPPLSLEVGAIGHTDRIDIARLYSEVMGGTLNATGQVVWQDGLRWQAQFAGEHLDLARWRDLPASDLALRLRSEGAMKPHGVLEAFAELEQLSGHLAHQPVDASARVTLANKGIQVEPLQLRVGASTAFVQGSLGETVNLRWTLHGRELQAVDERLAGNIDAEGTVSGFRAAPHVQLNLSGANLRAMQASIDRIELDATATLAVEGIDRARLRLHSSGLAYGANRIDQLLLRAQGDGASQNAVLAMASGEHGATFALKGAAQGQAWEGAVESGIVAWAPDLTWRPTWPTKLRIEPGRMSLDKACWKSEQGYVCATGEHTVQGPWRIAVRAPELGLRLLQRWVPTQIDLTGTVDASLNAEGNPGQIARATAQVQFDEATFRRDDLFGPPTEIKFSGAQLQAKLDEAALNVTAGLKMTPGGTLQARAHLPAPALFASPMSSPIDARVEVKLQQLDALSTLLPGVADVKGRIDLTVALSGTLQDPQLKGRLDLAEASLKVPAAGLEINELKLGVQAKSVTNVVLTGSARSGDGAVTLSGNGGLRDKGFSLKARLQGENFTTVDTRELRALLSPDITVNSSVDGTTVTGTVRVPEATIRIKKPKGAVHVSNDVLVVEERSEAQTSPHRVAVQVRVELGERVNMDAFNLRAHLGGGAQINMEPAKPATAVGTFRIEEGFYEAWGVALRIEHGRFVYVNSPLSNPGLDVRATRKAGDVLAGLNVGGTLADPKIQVFSEPPMNDSDAFSYLLFGRPLTQSTGAESGEGYDAVNAARSMGLEIAAQQLSQKLGLEDVRVQTDEEGNSTVVMGRYLSPKIYVGYGVDVVEQITSFHLDYILSQRWTIRTQTSAAASAADLVFSLDTD